MRAAVLALGLASIVLAGSYGPAMAEPIASGRVHVLDGDTIRVDGRRPDVRLVGFNAPETTRAQCAAEGDLGEVAARRLRALVAGGGLISIRPVFVRAPGRKERRTAITAGAAASSRLEEGCRRGAHGGRARGAVPMRRDPLPGDAAAVVRLSRRTRVRQPLEPPMS